MYWKILLFINVKTIPLPGQYVIKIIVLLCLKKLVKRILLKYINNYLSVFWCSDELKKKQQINSSTYTMIMATSKTILYPCRQYFFLG